MPDRNRAADRAGDRRQRVLIAGYYGYGNVGDEAILQSLLRDLASALPEAEFLVLYGSAAAAPATHASTRVRYLPRLQPPAIRAAMRTSGMLVLGGGTLIQDVTSLRSLLYYLSLIWVARRGGLRVALYGGGLGPLTTALGRRLASVVLPTVDLLALRDRRSIETALALGVPADRIILTADPAFSVLADEPAALACGVQEASAGPTARAPMIAAGVPADRLGSVMALALRPPLTPSDRAAIVAGVRDAVAQTGLFPLLVPFHPERDLPLLVELGAQLDVPCAILRAADDPQLLQQVVADCRVMLAMRLHGVIFAVAAGVPCVAMAYDPKVDALADDVPALRYAHYPGVDARQLAEQLRAAAADGDAVRAELRRCAAELGLRAAANARAVAGLLRDEDADKPHVKR